MGASWRRRSLRDRRGRAPRGTKSRCGGPGGSRPSPRRSDGGGSAPLEEALGGRLSPRPRPSFFLRLLRREVEVGEERREGGRGGLGLDLLLYLGGRRRRELRHWPVALCLLLGHRTRTSQSAAVMCLLTPPPRASSVLQFQALRAARGEGCGRQGCLDSPSSRGRGTGRKKLRQHHRRWRQQNNRVVKKSQAGARLHDRQSADQETD